MNWIAHRRDDGVEQTLRVHCITCGEYARKAVSALPNTAYLAGVLHDAGKYSAEYQQYLRDVTSGIPRKRGSTNHTFAGVRFVLEHWHTPKNTPEEKLTAELIAFAIGSHHGLFDCLDGQRKNGFEHRLTASIPYGEVQDAYLKDCLNEAQLNEYFSKAVEEVKVQISVIQSIIMSKGEKAQPAFLFTLTFLGRLITSAVIEGDRRDTAEFMRGTPVSDDIAPPWQKYCECLEENLRKKKFHDTPLNKARQMFSEQAMRHIQVPAGIYTLPLPTGGGKTLTGLRYTLQYAKAHHKIKRIFFVIPLLSILEQNAIEIREALGNTVPVLEHHSNLVQVDDSEEELNRRELMLESWDSPIVITTLVQLLNTLFEGKTSCIRRMQALTDSIIVIDEVQSVPKKLLSLFHLAMNALAYQYGATIILSSATQPCSEITPHPMLVKTDMPIVRYDKSVWDLFSRTEIIDNCSPWGHDPSSIATLMLESVEKWNSVLAICNTKNEARELYRQMKGQSDIPCIFLSTDLCPAHRRDSIARLKAGLDMQSEQPIICISTQLIEAGVDVSFGCVIRIKAGMDNIIQSAGRCNRHGEHQERCPVYIVNWREEALGSYLADIEKAQVATTDVLVGFKETPELFDYDLSSNESTQKYYQYLYRALKYGEQDYPIKGMPTMLELLSTNVTASKGRVSEYCLQHRAKTAGEKFIVFNEQTTDVLVPYKQGREIIANLSSEKAKYSVEYTKEQIELAKAYTVSLYEYQVEQLKKCEGLVCISIGNVLAIQPGFYSEILGCTVNVDEIELDFLEG